MASSGGSFEPPTLAIAPPLQLPILFSLFLINKHTHTRKREWCSNTKAHHNSTQKKEIKNLKRRYKKVWV